MNEPLAEAQYASQAPGVERWLRLFGENRVPVLSSSRNEIQHLHESKRDTIPRLCQIILRDAGYTLNLMAHTNRLLKERKQPPAQSLNHAALLMGVPFLHSFNSELKCIEDLPDRVAKNALLQLYQQNYHAASQACEWLSKTPMIHQDELFLCGMLQQAEKIHLWIAAPEQAKHLLSLEPEAAEKEQLVLGCSLNQLANSYATHGHFSLLYTDSTGPMSTTGGQALRLARIISQLADQDWFSEQMLAQISAVAELTQRELEQCLSQVHQTAARSARELSLVDTRPAACGLVEYPGPEPESEPEPVPVTEIVTPQPETVEQSPPETEAVVVTVDQPARVVEETKTAAATDTPAPTNPRPSFNAETYKHCLLRLKQAREGQALSAQEAISTGMQALREGLGLTRVSFLMMNKQRDALVTKFHQHAPNTVSLRQVQLALVEKTLFSRLMQASQCLFLHDGNRNKYWSLIPAEFRELHAERNFLAMSVFIKDKPIGMFYADNQGKTDALNEKHQQYFKQICQLVSHALAQPK